MITILTPTYNRSREIVNLFESLKMQTDKNFEWVIVDDGSNDDTYLVLNSIKNTEPDFEIKIHRQDNGGKHRAINAGLKLVKGEWTFIVDSDDVLVPNAISMVSLWINESEADSCIAAVSGLRASKENLSLIGKKPKFNGNSHIDVSYIKRRKYNLLSDKAEIYRTDILKKYPFMEFEGENFITESTVWNEIAKAGYKIRYYNEIIYLGDYLDGGLTKSKGLNQKNFQGFTLATKQRIKLYGVLEAISAKGLYCEEAKIKGLNLRQASKILNCNVISLWICYVLRRVYCLILKIQN